MPRRILIPTDVPFWDRQTGAQQRIAAMVDFLSVSGHEVNVFFLATGLNTSIPNRKEYTVTVAASDHPPNQFAQRMAWYAAATANQLKIWAGKPFAVSDQQPPRPLRLEEFRWPWAIRRFAQEFGQFKPDCVIIEYIKLAYLLEGLTPSQRAAVHCLVDTHDVLHLRAAQFHSRGLLHWLDIDRDAEVATLKKFDTILAIAEHEASWFREFVPQANTIVVGHAASMDPALLEPPNADPLRLGFIGSNNLPNLVGIQQFIEHAWPAIRAHADNIRLVIAGRICEALGDLEDPRIQQLGIVDRLESFYENVDLVINPVTFGTGLKIKNCESLCFGRPLVTTAHGAEGMPAETGQAFREAEIEQMAPLICTLANDPQTVKSMGKQALQVARSVYSVERAYSELQLALLREN